MALEIETRPLGHSEVRVPRVMLGCGNFGGVGSAPEFFGKGLDQAAAFELMDAAWELGITHFDTADGYGGGASEAMIGAWMRERGVRPQLTTKTFNPLTAGGDGGLAPERVPRALAASLERLGVERVDLYLAHDFDPDVPARTVADTFGWLRDQGLVRATGVSNYDAAQLSDALAAGPVDAIQNSYSLLAREDEARLIPLCAREEVAYTCFSPLAGGWLTGKYRRGEAYPSGSRMTQRPEPYAGLVSDAVFEGLERLAEEAAAREVSMAALALAWLLASPQLTSVVLGPGRPEHLKPLREALSHPLDEAEHAEIGALL